MESFGAPLENEWAGRDITPVLEAMLRGDATVLWGDLVPIAEAETVPFVSVRRANTVADFWSQSWAANLTELWSDAYETTALSEEEWEAMMSWLYEAGWFIRAWDRAGVECEPDNAPARTWISPRILEELAAADAAAPRRGYGHGHHQKCSGHHHHHETKVVAAVKAPKAVVVIPRFCRAGTACTETSCRYTHGDTIPVQNKPCAFDGRCCGEKRATCIYLHPSEGEIWSETLVRHRPTAAPATVL